MTLLNNGSRWTAVAEEGYFGSVYPDASAQRGLGAYPGPFTVVNSTTAYFLGLDPAVGPHGSVEFNGTMDGGAAVQRSISCIAAMQRLSLHFLSPSTGWVVGNCHGETSLP